MVFFLSVSVYIVPVIVHIGVFLYEHNFTLDYNSSYIFQLFIMLFGDIESNPGPLPVKHRKCCMLYNNIRSLHGNLSEHIAASSSSIY